MIAGGGPIGRRLAALAASLMAFACAAPAAQGAAVREAYVEVLEVFPHDEQAFTQGLEWYDGALLESTGQFGESSLRRVEISSGEVEKRREVDSRYFAEGLTRVGDRLIQLTWQAGEALVYDAESLAPRGRLDYRGEGWGLCFDGERLVMSDGSSQLTFRDPETFAELSTLEVTLRGRPLRNLNELECVHGEVYANVFGSDVIVAIDPLSGRVTQMVDASGLLPPSEARHADVLNGIAWDPVGERFLVTGKNWPKLFAVRFVER
ncbi:MAG: glutaminyl-peptide cyclotransferase [Acidobacteriota bacterium]